MTHPTPVDRAGGLPRRSPAARPSCALCGTSVHSGAILTATTDASGTHRLTCEAWCGTTPAPVLSHTRLTQAHTEAATRLERELLAELHLTRALVRRAEKDHGTRVMAPVAPPDLTHPTPTYTYRGTRYDLTGDLIDAPGDVWRWLGTWDEDGSPRVVCMTDPSVDHADPASAIDSIAGLVDCIGHPLRDAHPTRAGRGGAA